MGDVVVDWMKRCPKCGMIKPYDQFYAYKQNRNGRMTVCKKCRTTEAKEYKSKNRERFRQKHRAAALRWLAKNPDYENKRRRKKRNPFNYQGDYYFKPPRRITGTPQGKLSRRITNGIYHSLKRGTKGGRHWYSLVGYSVDELKIHLEKQFTPEMSWENYGSYWHIDHKIPVSAFNYETPDDYDFKRCWALKNLRPLEAKKNQSKGGKIEQPFQPALAITVKTMEGMGR